MDDRPRGSQTRGWRRLGRPRGSALTLAKEIMSETLPDEIKLNDLMFKALDHAVFSIEDNAETLIPFSLTEDASGQRTLTRYVADRIEVGVEEGKKKIEASKDQVVRYAFAYDGYLTLDGHRWEGLFVEAGDKVAATGVLLCQRYKRKKGWFKKGVEPFGNPVLVGTPPSRIK